MNFGRKLLRITGIIILSIIAIMIMTVALAKVFEDRLASFTMEKLESTFDAPMSVGNVSLIPLFSFPRLSAEIHNLYIGDPHNKNNDTLFYINSLKVGLDSWGLMSGKIKIDEMKISGLDFDYVVDSTGKSNIDFIIDAFADTTTVDNNDTISIPLDLSADKVVLENIHVKYHDKQSKMRSWVTIPEITLKGKTKNNIFNGKTKGSIILSHCSFEGTNIDRMESCSVVFNMEYRNRQAKIEKLNINSEGINLSIEGDCRLRDTLGINAIINAEAIDFETLRKYIPDQFDSIIGKESLPQMKFLSLELNLDYHNDIAAIKKLKLDSDGLGLAMGGNLLFGDSMDVEIGLESLNINLGIVEKYLPDQLIEEYGIAEIGGDMELSAIIDGRFADSTLIPDIDAEANLRNMKFKIRNYPKIDDFNLLANIKTGKYPDMRDASVRIANAEINSNSSRIQLEGNIIGFEEPRYSLSSDMEINLPDFSVLIPDSLVRNLKGNITASIKTNGVLPEKITDGFIDYAMENTSLTFSIKDVEALVTDSLQVNNFTTDVKYYPQASGGKDISIENLNLESPSLNLNLQNSSLSAILSGEISDPGEMSVDMKSLKIQNGNSQIIGNGEITNFKIPEFNINTNITLELSELMPFVPDSLINNMSGNVVAYIHSNGKLNIDSVDSQLLPVIFKNSNINIALNDIDIAFPDSVMNVDDISARIGLRNDKLTINELSADYNGLEIGVDSTIMKNIYSTVILNQPGELYVETHIDLGDFLFDDFKHLFESNSEDPGSDMNSAAGEVSADAGENNDPRNWTYLIHGSAGINSIKIDSTVLSGTKINRLHINDLSTMFLIEDSSYVVDQFKFSVFGGEMNNSAKYRIRKDGTESVSSHNIIQNMDIHAMLRDMDNFGMDSVISYENISGIFSTDLHTFIPIDDSVRVDKMMVSGDLTLQKGGVYDYAPATEISRFTNIKELDNIQFKTLRSNIFMFKNKLYVPRTNIVSNAMDIAAFGMQDLDGDCEYHLELHLSNILFGKSKRRNKKQDKSGDEVDKGSLKKSSRKIRYVINDKKSKVGLDSKDSREDMMNKIRVQKKMLDFIFFPKNIYYNTNPEK